jgi:curved DNA-binding protein CbpA
VADRDAYEVLGLLATAHDVVIQAAYRALAALFHPDSRSTAADTRRMAELNGAYAKLRTPARRGLYDAERRLGSKVSTTSVRARPNPPAPAGNARVLTFGRYEGWTIDRLAHHDPEYLRWLSRHSSGLRYRTQIEKALAAVSAEPTMSERVRGR